MKTIIAVDGLDATGKTRYINTTLQFDPKYSGAIFRKFPGAHSAAHAYLKKTDFKSINVEYLSDMMLNEIVSEMWRFYNMPDVHIMICDRFLFSNFLYTINPIQHVDACDTKGNPDGEGLEHFKSRFVDTWNKQTGEKIDSIEDLIKYFSFETHFMVSSEPRRREIISARKEPDFVNNLDYQTALFARYSMLIDNPEVASLFLLPNSTGVGRVEKFLDSYIHIKGVYR